VDGVLSAQETPPRELKAAIISRLKLMAKLNIAERRLPQDGASRSKFWAARWTCAFPRCDAVWGKRGDAPAGPLGGRFFRPAPAGLRRSHAGADGAFYQSAHGIFLVTGPTGSGKSTTLYSALKRINLPDKKIITIEDPVEYQMTGSTRST